MTPHSTAEFHMINAIAPVVFAIAFICISSLLREPDRRNFMAIMVGGAGAAYLSGGGHRFTAIRSFRFCRSPPLAAQSPT
jgi:hypothetical protein